MTCTQANRLEITSSTVSNNTARFGGGIFITCGTSVLTLTNSTVSGNNGSSYGGGIANTWYASAKIRSTTIAGNASGFGGGIENRDHGSVHLSGSIIADSSSGGDCSNSAVFHDDGWNVVEDGRCIMQGTSVSGDPGLKPLADNGGGTYTQALSSSSRAVDAGHCFTGVGMRDQRGLPRNDWHCDSGAFELQLADSAQVTKTVEAGHTYTFGPTMAKIAVVDSGGCLHQIQVSRVDENHPQASPVLKTGKYWVITPRGCTQGFTVNLTLPHNQPPDANDKLCRFDAANHGWDCSADSFETIHNTITRNQVHAFSDWTTGEQASPTAIDFFGFGAMPGLSAVDWLIVVAVALTGCVFFLYRRYGGKRNDKAVNGRRECGNR